MAISGEGTESASAAFIATATPTTLYTNAQGAGKIVKLAKLLILNVDTATAVTMELYKVPSGGTISGDDYKIVKGRNVQPSAGLFGTEDVRECADLILDNGDSLRAMAGTASKLRFDLSLWKES